MPTFFTIEATRVIDGSDTPIIDTSAAAEVTINVDSIVAVIDDWAYNQTIVRLADGTHIVAGPGMGPIIATHTTATTPGTETR
jgi:hypothetical protein